MADEIQTFRVCQNVLELEGVTRALEEGGIEFLTAPNTASFDISAIGSERTGQMIVRIRASDFERANKLLLASVEQELTEVPADHYLHEFGDPELLEILAAAHEWNEYDVACTRLLLAQRGYDLSDELVEEAQEKRLAVEREGKQGSRFLLIFAVLCGIAGVLFWLGWVIALLISWSFRTMKSTDPHGERFPTYDERTRREGELLTYFGALCFVVWCIVQFVLIPEYFAI